VNTKEIKIGVRENPETIFIISVRKRIKNLELIFGNHSPKKKTIAKRKKKDKSFTNTHHHIAIYRPKHAKYLFQDTNCAKKEHAIFGTR